MLELRDMVAVGALLVTLVTLLSNLQHRKERATKEMLMEFRTDIFKALDKQRSDLNTRVSPVHARVAEVSADLSRHKLEYAQHQGKVVTRADMDDMLEAALEPLLLHVKKSEAFMEEILRSGVLLRNVRRQP